MSWIICDHNFQDCITLINYSDNKRSASETQCFSIFFMGKIIVIPSYSIPHPINGPKYVVSFLLNHGFPMLSVNCFLFFLGGKGRHSEEPLLRVHSQLRFAQSPWQPWSFPWLASEKKILENPMKIL